MRNTKDETTFETHELDLLNYDTKSSPVEAESIDLAVFSPPYFESGGYSRDLMNKVGTLLHHTLKPGARAFMNFGQVQEDMARPFKARSALLDGFRDALSAWQTVIWVKSVAIDKLQRGHYQPINSKRLLNYCFEYVFQFVKGDPEKGRPLDRLSVGVPFADKTNLDRGTRGQNGDLHCAGDVWFIPYETTGQEKKKDHRHGFPLELARRCVAVAGLEPGSVVLDPFMGGGTTAVAARLCGMNAVGIDRDPLILEKATKIWSSREGERWVLQGGR